MDLPAQDFMDVANGRGVAEYIAVERVAIKSEIRYYVSVRAVGKSKAGANRISDWRRRCDLFKVSSLADEAWGEPRS
jgi:hypothetical protein